MIASLAALYQIILIALKTLIQTTTSFSVYLFMGIFLNVYVCITSILVPTKVRDGTRSPGLLQSVVGCHVGPENTTQVLWQKDF